MAFPCYYDLRHGLHIAGLGGKVPFHITYRKLLSCMTVFNRPRACIHTPLCVTLALHLTRIKLVCIGKVAYVCGCMCACICPFAWCITSCVSLTGPVPRWPPCHATLLSLRPTGSDTCEMLTWSDAAPSRASGCCSLSHSSPLSPRFLALSFFFSFSERPPKTFVPLCSPFYSVRLFSSPFLSQND